MTGKLAQLDVVNQLSRVYSGRQLQNHRGEKSLRIYPGEKRRIAIVLDLSESQKILTSRSFKSFNYFEYGLKNFSRPGYDFHLVREHFQRNPLFLEGEEHHFAKNTFNLLLKQQGRSLEKNCSRIKSYMIKRKRMFDSANQFANKFVEICLALLMSELSSAPLKITMKTLRARRNVFYFHFDPRRHKVANHALSILEQWIERNRSTSQPDHELLLCQSYVLMAYDPLVATICASIVEGRTKNLASNANRYCPTSFVSRVCIEPISIGDLTFETGDICYVSLVPAADEKPENTFPFGAGRHICSGQRLSIQMLKLAEEILESDFRDGFRKDPVLSPDGSFLAFQD